MGTSSQACLRAGIFRTDGIGRRLRLLGRDAWRRLRWRSIWKSTDDEGGSHARRSSLKHLLDRLHRQEHSPRLSGKILEQILAIKISSPILRVYHYAPGSDPLRVLEREIESMHQEQRPEAFALMFLAYRHSSQQRHPDGISRRQFLSQPIRQLSTQNGKRRKRIKSGNRYPIPVLGHLPLQIDIQSLNATQETPPSM